MQNTTIRAYSRYTQEAVTLLGNMIRLRRKEHNWSTQDLADRMGISRTTLQKIETGNMKCEIGLVFEAASLVNIRLFNADFNALEELEDRTKDKISLLPKSIRKSKRQIDDNF